MVEAQTPVVVAARSKGYAFKMISIGEGEPIIIKVMVLLHSAVGTEWQPPPKGTSLRTLSEAEEQGFILIRGEFQKRQFRLTDKGAEYVERDKRRLQTRDL